MISRPELRFGETGEAHRELILRFRIIGRVGRKRAGERERLTISGEGAGRVGRPKVDVADIDERLGKMCAHGRIGGVSADEFPENCHGFFECGSRPGGIARLQLDFAVSA